MASLMRRVPARGREAEEEPDGAPSLASSVVRRPSQGSPYLFIHGLLKSTYPSSPTALLRMAAQFPTPTRLKT